jgi:hypothetical protein
MRKALSTLAGAVVVGGGLSLVGIPHTTAAAVSSADDQLAHDYAQVWTGMPISRLGALGFDTAKAESLSRPALMEQFMPKNRIAFDALAPAVKNCYIGPDDCTAFIFSTYTHQTLLLVQSGRVTWKMMADSTAV